MPMHSPRNIIGNAGCIIKNGDYFVPKFKPIEIDAGKLFQAAGCFLLEG